MDLTYVKVDGPNLGVQKTAFYIFLWSLSDGVMTTGFKYHKNT